MPENPQPSGSDTLRAVVFDLDGTLAESLGGIAGALNRCLEALGEAPLSDTTVRSYIGDGSRVLMKRALPELSEAEIDAQEQEFQSHYTSVWRAGTTPFKGSQQLLRSLAAKGLKLGVLSNKVDSFTKEIVAEFFPESDFEFVLGQREGHPKKPDSTGLLGAELCQLLGLSPSEIAYVGDSTVDLEFALGAGFRPAAVSWGYHDEARLAAYDVPVFRDFAALEAYLMSAVE